MYVFLRYVHEDAENVKILTLKGQMYSLCKTMCKLQEKKNP